MSRLSQRIQRMSPSATLELTAKVADLKQQGVDVISFSVGEPDFDTPENVCVAAKKAIDDGYTRYTPAAGYLDVRKAICAKLQKDNNLEYAPNQIIITTGAKQALINALMVLCDPGDEVIIPAPCWVSYVEMVKLCDSVPVIFHTKEEEGFQLNVEELKKAITPKTKAILINTPNNPTGAVYSEKTLRALGELCAEKGIYILSDEVYEKLVFDGEKHYSVPALVPSCKDLCIVINGVSKAFAMTGWRLGYAAGPADIIKGMCSLQGHMTSNTSSIVQKAAMEALNGPQDTVEHMRQEFDKRRNYIFDRLNKMPGIKCEDVKGAFYVMPNISSYFGKSYNGKKINDSNDFAAFLLDEVHIAIVPGVAFESPNNARISYASSMENIKEGMDRMEKALALLK